MLEDLIGRVIEEASNGLGTKILLSGDEFDFLSDNWDSFISELPAELANNISLVDGDVIDEEQRYLFFTEMLQCQHYM